MKKVIKKITRISMLILLVIFGLSCDKDSLPTTETLDPAGYYGEWQGATTSARSLTSGSIIETPVTLNEIMSLRRQNGVDTFNFKDPATGMNIAGRQGTWYVTQVNNSDDATVNGAKILRLRVISSATRIIYSTLTINQLDAKKLVLNDGANKTLTYNK